MRFIPGLGAVEACPHGSLATEDAIRVRGIGSVNGFECGCSKFRTLIAGPAREVSFLSIRVQAKTSSTHWLEAMLTKKRLEKTFNMTGMRRRLSLVTL